MFVLEDEGRLRVIRGLGLLLVGNGAVLGLGPDRDVALAFHRVIEGLIDRFLWLLFFDFNSFGSRQLFYLQRHVAELYRDRLWNLQMLLLLLLLLLHLLLLKILPGLVEHLLLAYGLAIIKDLTEHCLVRSKGGVTIRRSKVLLTPAIAVKVNGQHIFIAELLMEMVIRVEWILQVALIVRRTLGLGSLYKIQVLSLLLLWKLLLQNLLLYLLLVMWQDLKS